jgi:hypothetical protein
MLYPPSIFQMLGFPLYRGLSLVYNNIHIPSNELVAHFRGRGYDCGLGASLTSDLDASVRLGRDRGRDPQGSPQERKEDERGPAAILIII